MRLALGAGPAADALALAKAAHEAWPDDERLPVLVAAAYLADDNAVWALRTLARRLEGAPDDCEARVWLAWAKARLGRYADLVALLDLPACTPPDARGTRALLLRALGHHHARAPEAARADLDRARAQARIFPEDAAALAALARAIAPHARPPLAWRVDLALGHATNPLLGAPNDPDMAASTAGSPTLELGAWARLAPDLGLALAPVLELEPRLTRYLSADAAPLSTFGLAGRLGLVLGRDLPRAQLAWRPDYVLLSQGDAWGPGPVWAFGAHRGELEVELSEHLLVFGGGGWRDFRTLGRSRAEADLGLGGLAPLGERVALLWAVTTRMYRARDRAYDLLGATAVTSLHASFAGGLWARANGAVGLDHYPSSAGFFETAEARRDLAVRAGAEVGLALGHGLKVSAAYALSWRDSTAPAYGATDHRLSLRVSWAGERDLGGPAPSDVPALAPLAWGFDGAEAGGDERVQDLLRQDEQVRPSCGCGP